jgi:hypothetical protein
VASDLIIEEPDIVPASALFGNSDAVSCMRAVHVESRVTNRANEKNARGVAWVLAEALQSLHRQWR